VSAVLDDARAELRARCNTIEEAYEYMLAYAAQGAISENSQIREFLRKSDEAVAALIRLAEEFKGEQAAAAPYAAFLEVVSADACASQAAIRLVIAQPIVTSALIDNLNASIHLRALLTDLFLLDEALKKVG
jgi:hypothetical protein